MPTAYAPTTRKRASAAHNAESRSRKSLFTGPRKGQLENLFAALPSRLGALVDRDAIPDRRVVVCGRVRLTVAEYTHVPAPAALATLFQRFRVIHWISLAPRAPARTDELSRPRDRRGPGTEPSGGRGAVPWTGKAEPRVPVVEGGEGTGEGSVTPWGVPIRPRR